MWVWRVARAAGLLGAVALGLVAGPAAGGGFTLIEGPGLLLTPSTVLHSSAGLESGYDSNVAFSAADIDAAFLRVMLRADYATRPKQRLRGVGTTAARQKIDFRLGLAAERRQYLTDGQANSLSSWLFDESGRLNVNPQGVIGANVEAGFSRTLLPRNYEPVGSYMRDVVRTGVTGHYRPRDTRFSFSLGYRFVGDWFESDDLTYADSLRHEVRASGRRQILPKLSAMLDVSVAYIGHERVGTVMEKADSVPLTILAGISGKVRPRLSANLKLGYMNGFYEERPTLQNDNLSLPWVEAGAVYQLRLVTGRLSGGYGFRPQDAIFGNFFHDHILFAQYDQLFSVPRFKPMQGSIRSSYRYRTYRGQPVGFDERQDNLLQIHVLCEVALKPWWLVSVGYAMAADYTDFRDPAGIPYDFVKHQAFARTQVAY